MRSFELFLVAACGLMLGFNIYMIRSIELSQAERHFKDQCLEDQFNETHDDSPVSDAHIEQNEMMRYQWEAHR